jgi:hypothetical protein
MSIPGSPGSVPPAARRQLATPKRLAMVSLLAGSVPLVLIPFYQPFIAVALRQIFAGAYIPVVFLVVPILCTVVGLSLAIAANIRAARLPPQRAYFRLAALALLLSILDVGLFFFVWLPLVTMVQAQPGGQLFSNCMS